MAARNPGAPGHCRYLGSVGPANAVDTDRADHPVPAAARPHRTRVHPGMPGCATSDPAAHSRLSPHARGVCRRRDHAVYRLVMNIRRLWIAIACLALAACSSTSSTVVMETTTSAMPGLSGVACRDDPGDAARLQAAIDASAPG